MTDKEPVIIDGVDVSGCNFRLERDNQQKCECTHATGFRVICDCDKWQNCYFKQLARKTQELETICTTFDIVYAYDDNRVIYGRCNKLREKEQELYLVKNEIHSKTEYIQEQLNVIDQLKEENEELKERLERTEDDLKHQCIDCMNVKSDRYRKALEEIEGILDNGTADTQINAAHLVHQHYLARFCDIRDIISKAKGEE